MKADFYMMPGGDEAQTDPENQDVGGGKGGDDDEESDA